MKLKQKGLLILVPVFLSATLGSIAQAETWKVSEWQARVQQSLTNQDLKKFKELTNFRALQKSVLSDESDAERALMHQARRFFAKEKFVSAIATYDKIEKGSDNWLEAVEEKGWSYHREKSFDKALAQTKTLLTPPFLSIVGSEPFFLQSLSQLKICDYKGVLETHQLFKESQKARILDLQALAKLGTAKSVEELIQKVDQFPLRFEQIGESARQLPRKFHLDLKLQKSIMTIKLAQALEGTEAPPLMSKARNRALEKINSLVVTSKSILSKRLQDMAQIETDENFKMLQKLNLIEIETIQRMHSDLALDKNLYQREEFQKASLDQLVFPDDGKPWIDELDKFQVEVNSCPQGLRRTM